MYNLRKSGEIIKLRGHHLICLHFFSGKGYNPEFVKNLQNVLIMVEDKEIEISEGADDICKRCPYVKDEKCHYNEHSDDEISEMDNNALHLLRLAPGLRVKWYQLRERLSGIFKEWYESYCVDCGWRRACEDKDFYRQCRKQVIVNEIK